MGDVPVTPFIINVNYIRVMLFINCRGEIISFDDSCTIEDLILAGVTNVGLVPKELPPSTDPSVYIHSKPQSLANDLAE